VSIQFFKIPRPDKRNKEKVEKIKKYINTEAPKKDDFWLKWIFCYLFHFYNSNTGEQYASKSENQIKKRMQDWFSENEEFQSTFSVNFEPRSQETDQEGYDDIKFQSQFWGNGRKFFVIECKILNLKQQSIKEYIFLTKTKTKGIDTIKYNDGGLYRFITNKYAAGQDYGGMIGFVQEGNIQFIKETLKSKIRTLQLTTHSGKKYGQLINSPLLEEAIIGSPNTFQSDHVRWDKTTDTIKPAIHMFHILFDFT
jgi:hypothetical protein